MFYLVLFVFTLMRMCLTQEENSTNVRLIATPSNFTIGLTPELTIACRFKKEDFPRISAVSSIVLYSSSLTDKPEYSYLASVSVFDGLTYNLAETVKVKGAVNSNNDSFLELHFKYPQNDDAGIYQCEVYGMERFGKAITIYNTAVVRGLMPDMFDIINRIRALTISNDHLERTVNYNTEQSQNILTKYNDMHQALSSIIFDYSPITNRRRYALSIDQTYLSYNDAQVVCKLYGGYLAEIDNKQEFDFVQNYLATKNLYQYVLIGGTDELQEGVWVNQHNNNSTAYVRWGGINPNGGRYENCLCFHLISNVWCSGDYACNREGFAHGILGFLCEIPE